MFKKNEKKLAELSTIIGEGTTLHGNLDVETGIRIDGKVYGEVKCAGDVTIGKDGYVENTLVARNLFLAGTVKGSVQVENKIHIYDSGYLNGKAEMKSIIIEENGYFQGESLMKGKKEEEQQETLFQAEREVSTEQS